MNEFQVMIIFSVILGIIGVIGIACYIMESLSYYTIAKRRLIENPWLAWIPVVRSWTMGAIAEDYDKRKGIERKWSAISFGLSVAAIVVGLMFVGLCVVFAYEFPDERSMLAGDSTGLIIKFYITYFVLFFVWLAYYVCDMLVMYKIFESTVPKKSFAYMIVSLIVPFGHQVCLLRCRNRGYSVRKVVYNPKAAENQPQQSLGAELPEEQSEAEEPQQPETPTEESAEEPDVSDNLSQEKEQNEEKN